VWRMARFRHRVDQMTSRIHSESPFDQLGGFIRAPRHHRGNLERASGRRRHHNRLGRARQTEQLQWRCACFQRHCPVVDAPHLAGKIMNRDLMNVRRSPDQSWDGDVHVSQSEFLSLLSSLSRETRRLLRGDASVSWGCRATEDCRQPIADARTWPTARQRASRCQWFDGRQRGTKQFQSTGTRPRVGLSAEAEVARSNRLTQRELAHASQRRHRPGCPGVR
jgi:hypothetical protein